MNLLRRAAETVMSLAVIVVFAGLLTVPEAEPGDGDPAGRLGAARVGGRCAGPVLLSMHAWSA